MSKRSPEHGTDFDQILTEGTNTQELLESVEKSIEDTIDGEYHYSLDIIHTDNHSIRIGVYGVEGFEKPSRQTVADAVAEQFGWTAAYEDGESTKEHYEMRIFDWDNDSEYL